MYGSAHATQSNAFHATQSNALTHMRAHKIYVLIRNSVVYMYMTMCIEYDTVYTHTQACQVGGASSYASTVCGDTDAVGVERGMRKGKGLAWGRERERTKWRNEETKQPFKNESVVLHASNRCLGKTIIISDHMHGYCDSRRNLAPTEWQHST